MKTLLVKCFAVCALLISGSAYAEECFDTNFAHDWSYDDARELLLVRSFSDTYEVKTFSGCFELPFAHAIGFDTFAGSLVCRGDKVVVFNAFDEVTDVCPITSITKAAAQ